MDKNKLTYVTKSGRLSKIRIPNLNFTGERKTREKKNRNKAFDEEREIADKMEGVETEQDVINRQHAELKNLRKFVTQQQQELQAAKTQLETNQQQQQPNQQQFEELRRQIAAQNAEIQRLRSTQPTANGNTGQPSQPPVLNQTRENYAADFCDILGNLQHCNIDVKTPEFKDENASNPLEFIDEARDFVP